MYYGWGEFADRSADGSIQDVKMRGVILAGGLGGRLDPLTKITNKHLLPIYDRPMIFYPIQTLVNAGIKEIMIVVSGPFAGDFVPLLQNGERFGLDKLVYAYQAKPDGGIADALSLAEGFVEGLNFAVILGDNTTDADISIAVRDFDGHTYRKPTAHLFLKEVPDPQRFGVPVFSANRITRIEEKPKGIQGPEAVVTGLYLYDEHVFDFIKQCSPSMRGELEITDVNNMYIKYGEATYSLLDGFWRDAGTFDTLVDANQYWKCKCSPSG